MAQLKDLIVNGASRFIGDIFGTNATFSGDIMPETDNTQSLGDSTHRWKLYGTITGSLDKTFKIKLNNTQYTYDGSANVDLSTIYAPTTGGTANQILVSAGGTSTPTWKATAAGAAYATSANGALTFGTLPIAQGGTGKTTWDINKITYASAADTLGQLDHASSTSYLLKSGSASAAPSWIQYTNANTASTIVQRDASGNFSAGTIKATLSGNAATATGANITTNTNGVAYYTNTTGAFGNIRAASGAFYSTGQDTKPVFGTLPVAQGGTGLTASPSILINLGSTTAENILQASPRPGITGTLPVANGGTGATSAADARTNLELGNGKIFYGTCATAAATTAKVVTCSDFVAANLVKGAIIGVIFDYKNSGAVAGITLEVNGTGAKPIKYIRNGALANLPAVGYILANQVYMFHYDGTNWVIENMLYDTNTNTLLRTYASSTDIDVPLIGQSSANSTTAAWSTYTGTYKDWYGVIPNSDAKRAKINLSTGLVTLPCGVRIGTTDASAGNSQLKFQRAGVNYIWAPYAEGDHGVWIAVNGSTHTAQGGSASAGNVRLKVQSDRIDALVALYGAVWNDYAEYRQADVFEPGRCIKEKGDDTLELTTQRLERGCEIISDTFGFAIGETDNCKTPIAASGRVLAYPYEDREEFRKHIGAPVCSGPNGTVSIMTEEEEEKYPSRIIGTISAVPDYEVWGSGNVKVNGRVWIRIR